MAEVLEPREVVVGDDREIKARLLRRGQIGYQLPDRCLLAHRRVPELHYRPLPLDWPVGMLRSRAASANAGAGRIPRPDGVRAEVMPSLLEDLAQVEDHRVHAYEHLVHHLLVGEPLDGEVD